MNLKLLFPTCFLLLLLAAITANPMARAASSPAGDSEVIVIVAPSVNDEYYAPVFEQVIAYDISFVNTVRAHTTVVLVVDSSTMPYVAGQVPEANLIEGTVNDIWARDFATLSPNNPVKFSYRPHYLSPSDAAWIEDSFNDWTASLGLNFTSSNMILDGGNFVHNGADKAIITNRVFEDNPDLTPEQVDEQLRDLTGMTTIAYIPAEEGDTTEHADGMVMWLDANTLLVSEYDEPFRSQVLTPLQTAFPDVTMVEIPVDYTASSWQGFVSACGLHVNSLVTDSHIFLPVYGQDNDAVVQSLIEAQTDKIVVPVNAEDVCFMGGAVRCLTWYVKDDAAETIIQAANPNPANTATPMPTSTNPANTATPMPTSTNPANTATPMPTSTNPANPANTATPSAIPTSTTTTSTVTATSVPATMTATSTEVPATATPTATSISATATPVATATATVDPDTGGTLTSPSGEVQLGFPSGAVDNATTVIYSQQGSPSQSTRLFNFAGTSFSVDAFDEDNNLVETFNENFTLTVQYEDEDWVNAGIQSEDDLSLFYWDGSQWVDSCNDCEHDEVNNTLTIMLDHLAEFALLGESGMSNQLYLPLIKG